MLLGKLQLFSITIILVLVVVGLAVVHFGSTVFAQQSQKAHFLVDPLSNQANTAHNDFCYK